MATPTSATKVTKNEWNTVQFEVNIPFDGETWTMVTIVHVPSGATGNSGSKVNIRNLNIWYGDSHAIIDSNLKIRKNNVTALIGPSGCGKSTLLRSINRMNDFIDICKT